MSNQLQITGGAKVRNLEGVLTGTSGVVSSLGINVPSGIPQLDGSGKILVSQLPNSVMEYKGTWSAATNTPTLVNGTGNAGDVYLCDAAGTVNFGAGPITFAVGDQVLYSGTIWQKASGATGTVTSVALTESGDALTITGSPITTSGTINIGFAGTSGQYINGAGNLTTFPSLTGYVPYTGATANVDLGTFDLTADVITGATGSFASSGGSDTFAINHSSGSGVALNITKGGNGEGLYINKTSGSGNAATIIGTLNATTLVKNGGTSSQYLMADGSVDSNSYVTINTTQTITGDKTFNGSVDFNNSAYLNAGVWFRNNAVGSTLYTNFSILKSGSLETLTYLFTTANSSKLVFNDSANYTYTFPTTSGTLALSSDLLSYVPYTGATSNVNLGTNEITASNFVAETSFSTKILPSGVTFRNGYSTLSSIAGNFSITQAVSAGNLKAFTFDFSAWATNTSYTYTLPAANGTLALTSNLSSYVPYTGASSDVNIGNNRFYSRGLTLYTGATSFAPGLTTLNGNADGLTISLATSTINYSNQFLFTQNVSNIYTFPNATGTIALLQGTQTFTGAKTFGLNNLIADGGILFKDNAVPSSYTTGYVSAWFNINGTKNSLGLASSVTSPVYYTYDFPNASGTLLLGTGTTNYLPKFTGASTLGNSLIFDNGTGVGINTSTVPVRFTIANADTRIEFDQLNSTTSYLEAINTARSTSNYFSMYTRGLNIWTRPSGTGSYAQSMTITDTGNVGIGTSSPSSIFEVAQTNGIITQRGNTGYSVFRSYGGDGTNSDVVEFQIRNRVDGSNMVSIGNFTSHDLTFRTANTERMRIRSDGNVAIGSTTGYGTTRLSVKAADTGSTNLVIYLEDSNTNSLFYVRNDGYTVTGTRAASPYNNTTAASANAMVFSDGALGRSTASSIRFKENVFEWDGSGLDTILSLKPKTFTYKEDYYSCPDRQFLGLIAEEVAEVSAYLADFENEDGTGQVENVRYANIVVPLIKAIQEQNQLISELSAKVSALENKG